MTAKQIGKEAKYIDEVQADALISAIEAADELHRTIVRLLLFTGMRRGEALGLKWSDIDFKKGTLKICRTIQYLPEIPFITLHSLRHTNATLQLAAGVPITTVSKRLGHSNTATTGRVYVHTIQSADDTAAEKLDDLFIQQRKKSAAS